ncbi:MAG: metallophosphoesterase [Pirellulales bacterium]|nr:metallophosphoesterase [Pirellulales bacterium]
MSSLLFLLLFLALLGHVFLWAGFLNRTHAIALPRWAAAVTKLITLAALAAIPGIYLAGYVRTGPRILNPPASLSDFRLGQIYLVVCWAALAATAVRWLRRRVLDRPPHVLRRHSRKTLELEPATRGEEHHFLASMPGNEILQLDVTERAVDLPRMPAALDGLSIVHLSDLHFTGRIGKAYFQEVVRMSNDFGPDLIAITGDLVDFDECIDWMPDTLGRLSARHGVYFILGNHDLLVDTRRLRGVLSDCGLIDLGGRWIEIALRGERVLLAGNELPWIAPAADLGAAPSPPPDGPLRILLAHTPDQFAWARANEIDLMLAGHTHGGQIRFPVLGPLLSPSLSGVTYASGFFYATPTAMQVSRGVSGLFPLRVNCPPEMIRLVLHAVRPPVRRLQYQ